MNSNGAYWSFTEPYPRHWKRFCVAKIKSYGTKQKCFDVWLGTMAVLSDYDPNRSNCAVTITGVSWPVNIDVNCKNVLLWKSTTISFPEKTHQNNFQDVEKEVITSVLLGNDKKPNLWRWFAEERDAQNNVAKFRHRIWGS